MPFAERLRQAPPSRRALIAVLAAVIVTMLLTLMYVLLIRKDYAVLFRDLRAVDAAAIVAELDNTKTPYRLENSGTTILVPEDVVDAKRLEVMSKELPLKGAIGFELFNKSDMGLTEFAQRINYQRALQGELARTIMAMETIETARVHLAITEQTVFRADRRPPKASVTLTPRAGRRLTPEIVRGVQRLIAASVPELAISDVVVLDSEGREASGAALQAGAIQAASVGEKQAIELYYAARVREAIKHLYPQGGLDVAVIAEAAPSAPSEGALVTVDPFVGWTPQARQFPLRVSVTAPLPLDPARQEDARLLAAEAIGQTDSGSDSVTVFSTDLAAAAPRVDRGAAGSPGYMGAQTEAARAEVSPRAFWVSALLGVLVLLGAAAAYLHLRRARALTLSDEERLAYAERLRLLLREEQPDAAQHV